MEWLTAPENAPTMVLVEDGNLFYAKHTDKSNGGSHVRS